MKLSLIVAIFLVGCAAPSVHTMDHGMYRISPCSSKQDRVQCSRLMTRTCPNGYIVLNQEYAQKNGPIISCIEE